MVCIGWKAQHLARRGMDIRAGNHPRKPSQEAQGVQSGVDQGGGYFAQARPAQRGDVLLPAAVLHVALAVLDAPVVAEQSEQLSRLTFTGTQAGQQIPAFSGYLPGGYVHSHPLHHCRLPRPGEFQLLPDVAGQHAAGPNRPPLDHSGFFSGVSARGSSSSLPAKPSVNASSAAGWFPLIRTK